MKHVLSTLLALALAWTASAATTSNDDSCDIAVLPAATLLLPYFEVDLDNPTGETTIFTITNVGHLDAITRVTLWTDHAYPVITFNVYLTGYDVQTLNLYDVIGRGVIAPDDGTGTAITKRGKYSDPSSDVDVANCARLPGTLDTAAIMRLRDAFTRGTIPGECTDVSGEHDNAIGYATIDVVENCSSKSPIDPAYWTSDIRYDNVLIGDYQQIDAARNFAQGGPMVHIRAVPEGGTPRARLTSPEKYDAGFERTFYARYQSHLSPRLDGRQPLPTQFAARWIKDTASGFETSLKIWRELRAGSNASCADYNDVNLGVSDLVVFDEQENAVGANGRRIELPATSRTPVTDPSIYPQIGAASGWLYLNLDRIRYDDVASQAWVITSMSAENGYSTDVDAIAMGNGCTAPAATSAPISPAPNESNLHGIASTNNDDSCDIALLPAATLLLPYFEVDLADRNGESTLFTITNVSPKEQIARVTLWTDYSFPVITFNIYLTGYDVQSINLYDVIARGKIAPDVGTGTAITPRGPDSRRNRKLDLGACEHLPGRIPPAFILFMEDAFREGIVPDFNELRGCNNVGNEHTNAVGYATIDVVSNCTTNNHTTAEYWTEDLAWNNVLIGDYQQLHAASDAAQSSTLVHIRAVPEGGTAAERLAVPKKYEAGFARTFYARFQHADSPKLDGRQPLPSVFASRWFEGGASGFQTDLKIWREGAPRGARTCATWDDNVTPFVEVIRFDDAENPVGDVPVSWSTCLTTEFTLPPTSYTSITDTWVYPPNRFGTSTGWIYLNLDNGRYCTQWTPQFGEQAWVITSLHAQGRQAVDMDAAALGNGCSPSAATSEITTGNLPVGPRP